jgi:hypothetical protein
MPATSAEVVLRIASAAAAAASELLHALDYSSGSEPPTLRFDCSGVDFLARLDVTEDIAAMDDS